MKKRLLVMLLLLCLLLTALTAAVSAFTVKVNGEDVRITFGIDYHCDICKTYPPVNDDDYTINSFQAYTEDAKAKPLAEWKYGDGLVLSVTIKNTSCSKCRTNGVNTPIQGGTFNVVIEAARVGYYCHKQFNFIIVPEGNFKFRFTPVEYLFTAEHHAAGPNSCEEDGYKKECWLCPCCGQCFDKAYTAEANVIPDNIIPKLGHSFDKNGVCQRCGDHAEAYISSITTGKTYYDTAANAISKATAPFDSVHVVSYERSDPITINKIVDLTVEKDVTVPEIRMESCSSGNTGDSVNINNYGTVNLFSSVTTVPSRYPGVSYTNHNVTERITAASTIAVQVMQISNKDSGTIGEINIPQTDNPTPKVQVTNNGGKIERLTGSPKNVELRSGTGSYGTITTAAEGGSVDSLLNKGCYFYFPNGGQKWVNSNAGKTVSNVIVSEAPFTVKVKQGDTELEPSNGSYTVDNVTVGSTVALGVDFTPNEYGLTVDESKITSRWYYKNESKTAADGKALTLNNIQYGVYDLIFEATESTYGFTTSVNVKVNVTPSGITPISLKPQPTSAAYTKVYNGTKDASAVLPPIEFQLADGREIRIPANCYNSTAEYASPDCIEDNKIIVTVTLTPEGQKHYELTGGRIEVPATITPYDGEWYGGEQVYKTFYVEYNHKPNDTPSIGKPVLKYLNLIGYLFDSEGRQNRKVLTSEDGFQYSFYHLRPGAAKPDPELDELLTADSVFTYPEDGYYVYAVVEPSLNYTGCITDSNSFFYVRDDKYINKPHTHDEKTYTDWNGSSLSIEPGETATRYLSGAQANVNVELALSQKKTLNLCLYNKAVHVIGSSHDQIYLVGGSTLVLSDCRKTGKVIGSAVASGSGGIAYVQNGTITIRKGKFTGGTAKTGGGAIVVDKDGVLTIFGGEISGNTVTSGKGGAIYIKSGGVVNMYGGKIQNNHVYSGNGGAIYVEKGGTLNLYGGEITGNTASGLGGGIYVEAGGTLKIQGNPVVTGNTAGGKANNVYVRVDSTSPLLTISGAMTSGAQLGISTDASYPALLALTQQDHSAYFTPDAPDTFVVFSGSALTLCAKPSATLEGSTLTVKTGGNYMDNTVLLFVAEYGADGRLLTAQSQAVKPETPDYTFKVSSNKIKCFLLNAQTYTPLMEAFVFN